jgi:Protein of unknown function (DUF3592)
MADLIHSRTTQQMRASGFAALLGLFAGLCAIFAACVTLSDWYDETAQARWPVVSALVERADVVASARTPKDGGGTVWKLRYRVRYEQNGEAVMATLTSRTAVSETDAAKLHAWAAQHRKGSHIDVRVDPSQANQAAFASTEISDDRTRTDFILFVIAALASAGMLALAKYLRAREARAAPAAGFDGASRGGLGVGLACAAMGLLLVGIVIHGAVHADPFTADSLMGVPAGLMFVFAGIFMALPPEYKQWRNLLATLLVTCFALTFDWVAFGPGERKFSGSFVGIGFVPSEFFGRASFGVGAVMLDIWAIAMWIGQCRRAFGSSTSGAPFIEQEE